jgi:ribosomal protein L20
MKALADSKIKLNRKILAYMAMNDKAGFKKLLESVKKK